MLKNYFKIAWRNITKSKGFAAINIIGLAIGMAVTMLIGLWVNKEVSFNKSFENSDRIAQVMQHNTQNDQIVTQGWNPYPLAEEIRNNYPDDFEYVIQSTETRVTIEYGEKELFQIGAYFEPEIVDLLSMDLLKGDKNSLLEPYSIILSDKLARSLFEDKDPINEVLKLGNLEVEVKGVYKDISENSTFGRFQFILPWKLYMISEDWLKEVEDPWRPNFAFTYAMIKENGDFEAISAKIKDVKLRNVDAIRAKSNPQVFLYPMNRWHLYERFENGINTGGTIMYVWLFGLVAIFVLVLACINFMNLATAQSEKRAKEVGIRKAIGSVRNQILSQFYIESFLMTFLALFVAVLLVIVSLPLFNELANSDISIDWTNPVFYVLILAFSFITGLLAGSYPAIFLSSFQPIKVLKGTFRTNKNAAFGRKALVVFQFTVSIAIVIGTLIVYQQIQFAKSRDLGYKKENLVNAWMRPNSFANFEVFKKKVINSGLASDVSFATSGPSNFSNTTTGLSWKGKDADLAIDIPTNGVGLDYGKTIGWEIVKGRDFSSEFSTDTSAVIVNEALAKIMGVDDPVGMQIMWDDTPLKVIGVNKNRVVQSAFEEPRPEITYHTVDFQPMMLLKLKNNGRVSENIAALKTAFESLNPGSDFQYDFSDEIFASKFKTTERVGKLASLFAILTIFISCLGLFGLAKFMAQRRTKEIGVRKVLGASVTNICSLLSKEFLILICISMLIAGPIAALYMNSWLQNYSYRMEIGIWVFILTSLGAIVITLLTTSFQAISAALMDPVKSLKSE